MPYPSPTTYPSALTFPGAGGAGVFSPLSLIALGDLVLNTVEADGTVWAVNPDGFEGWEGSPGSTLELSQRARGHGSTGSEPFFKSRTLVISGVLRTAPGQLSYAEDRLNAAVSLDPFLLAVAEQGRVRSMMVQRQDDVMLKARKGSSTLADFSVQIVAEDPLKYGDLVTATTLLPRSTTNGPLFPLTFPLTFTGVSNSGQVVINNPGNTNAPVWLRIDGPIPAGGWTVTHVGKKQALSFAASLALGAGEFVTVDLEAREILAQGQAPRAGFITSRGWFTLEPGENTIAFAAVNDSPTAQLTVTTRPAWS